MATLFEMSNSFSRYADQTEITRRYGIRGLTGTIASQIAQATAILPAIGATYYQSGLQAYQISITQAAFGHLHADVVYRIPQPDELIMSAASGAIVDKGSSADVEDVLRNRHPTSGATFVLGTATKARIAFIRNSEPRLEWWWDVVHTSLTSADSRATTLVGAINSSTFNGYAAAKWLCMSAITRSVMQDAGTRYVSRYSFVYKPETWTSRQVDFIHNNLTIASITAATKATAAFTLYRNANFATYGFTR